MTEESMARMLSPYDVIANTKLFDSYLQRDVTMTDENVERIIFALDAAGYVIVPKGNR